MRTARLGGRDVGAEGDALSAEIGVGVDIAIFDSAEATSFIEGASTITKLALEVGVRTPLGSADARSSAGDSRNHSEPVVLLRSDLSATVSEEVAAVTCLGESVSVDDSSSPRLTVDARVGRGRR